MLLAVGAVAPARSHATISWHIDEPPLEYVIAQIGRSVHSIRLVTGTMHEPSLAAALARRSEAGVSVHVLVVGKGDTIGLPPQGGESKLLVRRLRRSSRAMSGRSVLLVEGEALVVFAPSDLRPAMSTGCQLWGGSQGEARLFERQFDDLWKKGRPLAKGRSRG